MEHCESRSWSYYMICQEYLLDVSLGGRYCVPAGTSAARFQIEFVIFTGSRPHVASLDAREAAHRYFENAFPCT